MNQNNSRGFFRGLLFFGVGLVLGAAIGMLIHWLAAVQADPAYVFGRADLMTALSWMLGIVLGAIGFFYGLIGYRWVTRGLFWQFIGTLFGAALATALLWVSNQFFGTDYILFEFEKFGFLESSWVWGVLIGALAFLHGVGAISDWLKWARGESFPDHVEDGPGWEKYFSVSLD